MSALLNCIYIYFIKLITKYGIDSQNEYVLELIKSDYYRFTGLSDGIDSQIKYSLGNCGFQFLFFFRLASLRPKSVIKRRMHAFSFYFHKKYFFKYGFQIPISTKIGKGFQLLHFGNVVFNPECIIGENCTVAQGVLIGQSNNGTPIIGERVWIGANAIIVGNVKVGNNVLIAPGAYVNIDIPDNSLVIGNPCKIINKTEDIVNGYIVNTIK